MCSLKIVQWCILYSVFFVCFSDALKSGDEGACVVKVSTRKTRWKMVPTGKCGRKKCFVKRVEAYTAPEERIACCNGWEYNAETDTCGPVCSTGCIGGHCTAPEICQCDPPAVLESDHKNACVLPKCNPPCVNAECGFNNTCTCLEGCHAHNSTHCNQCKPGFVFENSTCTPVCKRSCINGTCVAPDTCGCFEGYTKKDDTICEPVCDVCVNGTCVSPNQCICLSGYVKSNGNDSVCAPKCEKCDGDCVAPNVCKCRDGMVNVNETCQPACVCEHGECSSSGECSCNEGFVKNGTICVKSDDCIKPKKKEVR